MAWAWHAPDGVRARPRTAATGCMQVADRAQSNWTSPHACAAAAAAAASATTSEPVHVLDEHSAPSVLSGVDTIVFDCDGVLWRGSEVLTNAAEVRSPACLPACLPPCLPLCGCSCAHVYTYAYVHSTAHCARRLQALQALRRQGKRLLFVTNNSSKSRKQYVAKFRSLGLEVAAEEVGAHRSAQGMGMCGAPGARGVAAGVISIAVRLPCGEGWMRRASLHACTPNPPVAPRGAFSSHPLRLAP